MHNVFPRIKEGKRYPAFREIFSFSIIFEEFKNLKKKKKKDIYIY
jgi:hypothetical protein